MDRRRAFGIATIIVAALLLLFLWPADPPYDDPAAIKADSTPVTRPVASRPASAPSVPHAVEAPAAEDFLEDDLQAQLEELEALDPTGAVCFLEPALREGRGHLIVGDPSLVPYNGRIVPVVAGRAFLFHLPQGRSTGVLAVEGYEPVPVTMHSGTDAGLGRCEPDPVRLVVGSSTISGVVRNAEGEPAGKVFVEGCGNQGLTDIQGDYSLTVSPGACTLQAFRRDGLLVSMSEPAHLSPEAGADLVVDFALPEVAKGGLGMRIEASDEGIRILDILPETAAEDVGLQGGDLIVEIDGESAIELTLQEFVEMAHGDAGTEIDVVVSRRGEETAFRLDRRVLN